MPVKILCLGDIVGKPGRLALQELLPKLIEDRGIDLVVANAENAAGGSGLSPPIFEKILRTGVDVCTMGDHTFRKREVIPILEQSDRLVRPANFPAVPVVPGKGLTFALSRSKVKVAVMNVMGRVFMPPSDDPFRIIDGVLASLPSETTVRIVDVHAEATSEKVAMGWHLDGRVSAVCGTHTHVQTADERILPGGTAYLTDLGMTGSYAGVIGMNKADVLARFTSVTARRAEHSSGDVRICAAVLDIDEETGRARNIERLNLSHNQ